MLKSISLGLGLAIAGTALASAQNVGARLAHDTTMVLAANGCGPGYFRTLAGECHPNMRVGVGPRGRVIAPPPCPPGFLRDPNPARPLCYPVY